MGLIAYSSNFVLNLGFAKLTKKMHICNPKLFNIKNNMN